MSVDAPKPPAPPSRWLYGVLIASLAINLLLVGLAVGGVIRHRLFHGHGGDSGLMGFVRELEPDRQPVLREHVLSLRQTIRPVRRELREQWGVVNAALGAEPFDKEQFLMAAAKWRETGIRFETAIANALADTAVKLTPEERRKLQAWREKHRPRSFGRDLRTPDNDESGKVNDDNH